MRGLWLGSSILPIFITVLIGVSALILFIWRSLILAFLLIRRRGHE
jgi:hypothetical protein